MLQFAHLLMAAVLAVGLLAAAAPTLAQTAANRSLDLQAAIAAFDAREFDRAADLLRPLADAGDPLAMTRLGDLHRLGVGAERDDAKAYALYRAAAEMGDSDAVSRAAFMLAQGIGVDASPEGAAELYMRAAEGGDASAQYNLALLYAEGLGVAQDRGRARALLLSAAGQGHEPSLQRLEALPPGYAEAMAQTAAPEPQADVASGAITQTQAPPVEEEAGVADSETDALLDFAQTEPTATDAAPVGGSVEIVASDPAQDPTTDAADAAPPRPRLRPARRQLDVAETTPAPTEPAPPPLAPEPRPSPDVIVETQAPPQTEPAPPAPARRPGTRALEIAETEPAPRAAQDQAAQSQSQSPAPSAPGLIIETQAPPATSPESWTVRRIETAADAAPAAIGLNVIETAPPPSRARTVASPDRPAPSSSGLHIIELQPAPTAVQSRSPATARRRASNAARFVITETAAAPSAPLWTPPQAAQPLRSLQSPRFEEPRRAAALASLEPPVLLPPVQTRTLTRDAAMAAGLAAYRAGAYDQAMRYWTPLAAARDGEALFRIGRMAARGEGRTKNVIAGYVMMRTALQCGYSEAQTALYNLAAQLTPAQRRKAEDLFKSNMRAIAAMR